MSGSTDSLAIQQLIARFANSFDLKDWAGLGGCLADELYTDYTDLRGTAPERMSRERFVALRQYALQAVRTHHLSGNVEMSVTGDTAEARVSMLINRRGENGEKLNTHCLYSFGLERAANDWVINSIVQKVLISEGETGIHGGIAKQ